MSVTVNNKDILACTVSEPRIGAWSAEFNADADEELNGPVIIHIDGIDFLGNIQRRGVEAGRLHCRVLAGRGGLGTELDAKFYVGASIRTVLNDIAREASEHLSPKIAPAVLGRVMARYTRTKASAGFAVRQVAQECGVGWRVLRDGTIWLGEESWPGVDVVYDELERAPAEDSITIAPASPTVRPGTVFTLQPSMAPTTAGSQPPAGVTKRVSRVTTQVWDGKLRQVVIFEDSTTGAAPPQSRMAKDVATVVGSLVDNRIDYSRLYAAKVIKQASDGTLELLADHEKVRGNGITRVPIRHGVPGMRVRVAAGSRVMLFFENGDPKAPAAALWPDGSSVREVELTASMSITITAPEVFIDGNLSVDGNISADDCILMGGEAPLALGSHIHTSGGSGSPTTGPLPGGVREAEE